MALSLSAKFYFLFSAKFNYFQIPFQAFQDLIIKRISFHNNNLFGIHPHAFKGNLIQSLEMLEIKQNHLKSVPLSSISILRNLETLILSNNKITTIDSETFDKFEGKNKLLNLDLSSNNISAIADEAFHGFDNLQYLNLDKNLLKAIPAKAINSLINLRELSISVNLIASITDDQQFPQLPNLRSISLEANQVRYNCKTAVC